MVDLDRLRQGDRDYRNYLVRTYGPIVMGVCRGFGRDYAHTQDLYQDCWVRVFKKQKTYRGKGPFEAWLHRVATRVCISEFRHRKAQSRAHERARQESLADDPRLKKVDPIAEKERQEARHKVDLALDQLTLRESEAIVLRVLEDRKSNEVAKIMGIKPSSVRSIVRHAMKHLREILEVKENELPRRK